MKHHDAFQGPNLEDQKDVSSCMWMRTCFTQQHDVRVKHGLTLRRDCRSFSFRMNPDTSSRPMRMRWTGLVFPSTAPIETRADAAHISATIKL